MNWAGYYFGPWPTFWLLSTAVTKALRLLSMNKATFWWFCSLTCLGNFSFYERENLAQSLKPSFSADSSMEESCSQQDQLPQDFLNCFSIEDLKAKNSKSIHPKGNTHLLSAHGCVPLRTRRVPWHLSPAISLPPAHPRRVVSLPEAMSLLSRCRWNSGNRIFFGPDFLFLAI